MTIGVRKDIRTFPDDWFYPSVSRPEDEEQPNDASRLWTGPAMCHKSVTSFTVMLGPGLSQYLETWCRKLAIPKFWGVLLFKRDYIVYLDFNHKCIYLVEVGII